tara:strand:+ start:57 stop:1253 length:1197 start_codon:yes stop_codon:yes gene_type:complete
MVAVVPLSYLLAHKLTTNKGISLLIALFVGFTPVLFDIYNPSPAALSLPLFLFALLSYMRLEKEGTVPLYLLSIVLLAFSTPLALLFVLMLCVYHLFQKIEGVQILPQELELSIFTSFLILWVNLIFFGTAFREQGIKVIWQNIPVTLLQNFFSDFQLLPLIYAVGALALILGVYGAYIVLFEKVHRKSLLLISLALVTTILLWLKLIPLLVGSIYLSVCLLLLSAKSLELLAIYLSKTKVSSFKPLFFVFLLLLFAFTSILPLGMALFTQRAPVAEGDLEAYLWMGEHLPEDAIIAAPLEQGHLVTAISRRKNVADSGFLYVDDAQERVTALNKIYTTQFQTELLDKTTQYDIDYIILSLAVQEEQGIYRLPGSDDSCFPVVYSKGAIIYEVRCGIN